MDGSPIRDNVRLKFMIESKNKQRQTTSLFNLKVMLNLLMADNKVWLLLGVKIKRKDVRFWGVNLSSNLLSLPGFGEI